MANRGLQLLAIFVALLLLAPQLEADEPQSGVSSRDAKKQAIRSVPLNRMAPNARQQVHAVINNPSFFRRMPSQNIECDPKMLAFLVRRPEVMVNIWDLMGVTKVSAQRTTSQSFMANDGVGTTCKCELVYSDARTHVYFGSGQYDGSMTPRNVTGRCVCVLHTADRSDQAGRKLVTGTMDVFLKLDNLGADLLTRTLGPFVGKTADYNFAETARFISQISQVCTHSPAAAQGLALRLNKVDRSVKHEFAALAAKIAMDSVDESYPSLAISPKPRATQPLMNLQDSSANVISRDSGKARDSQSESKWSPTLPRQPQPRPPLDDMPSSKSAKLTAPMAIHPQKQNIYMRR